MDPFQNPKAPPPEPMKPFAAITPIAIAMSLEELTKSRPPPQRILQTKGGLEHRFTPIKVRK